MVTQAERRIATRAKLLDAAMSTLVDRGIVGFTTTEVGQRAGLSHGAVFRHFPTKADLLAATVEHLYAGLRTRYQDQAAGLRHAIAPADRLRIGIVLLWEVVQDERMRATYDLYAAARTDNALRAQLGAVMQAHSVHLHALAQAIFGESVAVSQPRFHALVDLVSSTMHGMITGPSSVTDRIDQRRMLSVLADMAIAMAGIGEAAAAPVAPLAPLSVVSTRP